MSTKDSKNEQPCTIHSVIWRFISKNHKAIMWIGVCVGMAFTTEYGLLAPFITYLFGIIVGYVVWSKNAI